MKKIYITPSLRILEINMEHMIAASRVIEIGDGGLDGEDSYSNSGESWEEEEW